MEDCLPLKLTSHLEFPFEEISQVSILLDLVKCLIEFKAVDKLITLKIHVDAVCLHRKENRLEAKLCPLYGHTFLFDQAEKASIESLKWISVVTEYLQFGKSGQNLPDNHLLKKLLYQKWLFNEDDVTQCGYKILYEDLCDLHGK